MLAAAPPDAAAGDPPGAAAARPRGGSLTRPGVCPRVIFLPWPRQPPPTLALLPLPPPHDQAHANLANALQQLGAVDLALMYYSSALRLKPTFTDALNNMATAHLQKGAVAQVRRERPGHAPP